MECGGGGAAGDGDCVRERGFGEVRGAGPVGAQDEVKAKDGWEYELWDDRLAIGRQLGERVMDSPAREARPERDGSRATKSSRSS